MTRRPRLDDYRRDRAIQRGRMLLARDVTEHQHVEVTEDWGHASVTPVVRTVLVVNGQIRDGAQ